MPPSSENNTLLIVQNDADHHAPYTLELAAQLSGVHPDLLHYYCEHGLLGGHYTRETTVILFDDDMLYHVRRIEHLRHHHGVNRQALPLLCQLLADIERLQAEVRQLRQR